MDKKTNKNKFSSHIFEFRSVEKRKLVLSLIITLIVMFLEIFGGLITFSIALISDAGHMFTHAFALGISLLALFIARKPPCHHKTFGLYRAEVLAAFINGLFLFPIVGLIIYEAIMRFLFPQEIIGLYMFIIAFVGLGVNITSIIILYGSQNANLNIKSVFYHMIADAASSIGIVIVAIIITFTSWNFLDPLVSIGISIVILYWAWGILKESTRILLEMAPKGLDINIIEGDLKNNFNEVLNLQNTHLWTITPNIRVFSTHVFLKNIENKVDKENLVFEINKFLFKEYNIIESTIQIALKDEFKACLME